MDDKNKLALFQDKQIRRIWHNGEWWFSVVDVVGVLSESRNPSTYWRTLKTRLKREGSQVATKCSKLKLASRDGKKYSTDCANTALLLRLIQSIPSSNAEPFKQWLAKVGQERIQEMENPALGIDRIREYYRELGYSDAWINKRLQSIEIRGQLTDEWKKRGVVEGKEYSILTAEIAKAVFGMTPSEYKKYKNLKRENLRDHMTNLELIFTMLSEETTKQQTIEQDAKGFQQNRKAAIEGGNITNKTLHTYEEETGNKVVSKKNFRAQLEAAKKQRLLNARNRNKKK